MFGSFIKATPENPVLVGGDIYFVLNDPSDLHGQTGLNG